MDRIRALLGTFSPAEKQVLKKLVDVFQQKGKNRQAELFTLLEKHPDLDRAALSKKMYGNTQSKAFHMMKRRLYERMLESTLLSQHYSASRTKKVTRHHEKMVEIRKTLLFAAQIASRGLREDAIHLLEKAVKLSKSAGHPEFEIDALFHLRAMHSQDQLSDRYYAYSKALSQALRALETDMNLTGLKEVYGAKYEKTNASTAEKLAFLVPQLSEVADSIRQTPSPRALYAFYYLTIRKTILERNLDAARKAVTDLEKLLEDYPGLHTDYRLANPHMNRARIALLEKNWSLAEEELKTALKFFKPQHPNAFWLGLQLIFPALHRGDTAEAASRLQALKKHPTVKPASLNLSILNYFQAHFFWLEGDPVQARQTLRETWVLQNPRSGWFVYFRIFEIILLLECEEEDIAASKTQSLRKYLERQDRDPRFFMIYKILRKMELNSFRREWTPTLRKMFAELEEKGAWDPSSPELLPFEQWLSRFCSGSGKN